MWTVRSCRDSVEWGHDLDQHTLRVSLDTVFHICLDTDWSQQSLAVLCRGGHSYGSISVCLLVTAGCGMAHTEQAGSSNQQLCRTGCAHEFAVPHYPGHLARGGAGKRGRESEQEVGSDFPAPAFKVQRHHQHVSQGSICVFTFCFLKSMLCTWGGMSQSMIDKLLNSLKYSYFWVHKYRLLGA